MLAGRCADHQHVFVLLPPRRARLRASSQIRVSGAPRGAAERDPHRAREVGRTLPRRHRLIWRGGPGRVPLKVHASVSRGGGDTSPHTGALRTTRACSLPLLGPGVPGQGVTSPCEAPACLFQPRLCLRAHVALSVDLCHRPLPLSYKDPWEGRPGRPHCTSLGSAHLGPSLPDRSDRFQAQGSGHSSHASDRVPRPPPGSHLACLALTRPSDQTPRPPSRPHLPSPRTHGPGGPPGHTSRRCLSCHCDPPKRSVLPGGTPPSVHGGGPFPQGLAVWLSPRAQSTRARSRWRSGGTRSGQASREDTLGGHLTLRASRCRPGLKAVAGRRGGHTDGPPRRLHALTVTDGDSKPATPSTRGRTERSACGWRQRAPPTRGFRRL